MIFVLFAAATVTLTIPKPPSLDLDRMLDAIAQVENWDKHSVGEAGEWGPWQQKPDVFALYLYGSIRNASPEQLRYAAYRHLLAITRELKARGHSVTAFNCGLAWGGGIGLVGRKVVSRAKYDYATRVENIYGH